MTINSWRERLIERENFFAPYACHSALSIGRQYEEDPPASRTEYQRDRDRIIHSVAFRRLKYKTQVFVNHEGDHFRTRLTHSLEVAQIARSIARNLGLNEDLVEAISLAHDLGHTPFGHAGQDALNACMKEFGGFEHNLQSLAVVDYLEERYANFDGLNLTFETREGILKHCSLENAKKLGKLGQRFLNKQQPSLEAQLVNLADEIAYNNHDIDDGLRSGFLTLEALKEVEIWQENYENFKNKYRCSNKINEKRLIHEVIRAMTNTLIMDVIEESARQIKLQTLLSVEDVRQLTKPLICQSEKILEKTKQLKKFLYKHLYRHHKVLRMSFKASKIVTELFNIFSLQPNLLPPQFQTKENEQQPRLIAHYIAGMTDRYAVKEYRDLLD